MNRSKLANLTFALWLAGTMALSSAAMAADGNPAEAGATTRTESTTAANPQTDKNLSNEAIAQLKAQLAAQQKQIEQLRQALEAQQKMLDGTTGNKGTAPAMATSAATPSAPANPDANEERNISPYSRLGEVASGTPVIPGRSASPVIGAPVQTAPDDATAAPLQLKIGNAYISPVGFMDMTSVTRSTNPGSGIGTNFGSIPYSNTQAGSLSESRLSIQNSRIGARLDTGFGDFGVTGYWESDFLGQIGNPPNGGLAVTSNSFPLRLRLYWVDVRHHGWEFLAGQSWSLMTPGRTGISPLPSDVFYTQDMDVNYQAGLVWSRVPGFRGVYHFSDKAAFAVALENSEPYVGGGNGGSAVTLPAWVGTANAVSGSYLGGQINNGSSVISSAALTPDFMAKLALDPSRKLHFEIAGVLIPDRVSDPATKPAFQTNTKLGGGASLNLNFELFKGFRVLTNNYWSEGGGRYIFGQAPDFMLRANGDISLIHSGSTVTGFEAQAGKTLLYAYYGGVYIGKNLAYDTTGKLIGYGPIASDGQNRFVEEITFGTNSTLAKNAKWGALNLILQYSYVQRNPWLAIGVPNNANLSMGFVDLRYTLPGSGNNKAGAFQK